jgi:transcriptional regulator of heat shock response
MLEERASQILKAIIREYTETANPVSSSSLKEKYNLPYSSATIRNEMVDLENRGYIVKPHISSGRIPGDKGYRYFIDNLMEQRETSEEYQKRLEMELLKLKAKNARLERTTAKLLSSMSHCLAISGMVDKKEFYDFGMHTLLEDPEFENRDDLSRLVMSLDMIDENVDKLLSKTNQDETEIFIGEENPLKEARNCSMLVSPYELKNGERGLLAIIGPKRMKYAKNRNLMDLARKILGKYSAVLLLLNGTVYIFK